VDHTTYILKVLTNWKAFVDAHPKLKQALVGLLIESQQLKLENEQLKERLKEHDNNA